MIFTLATGEVHNFHYAVLNLVTTYYPWRISSGTLFLASLHPYLKDISLCRTAKNNPKHKFAKISRENERTKYSTFLIINFLSRNTARQLSSVSIHILLNFLNPSFLHLHNASLLIQPFSEVVCLTVNLSKLVKIRQGVEGSPSKVFILVIPTRSSESVNYCSPAFKTTFPNVVSFAGLLVTDPGHSLGIDGNLISQIHGGYWQFLWRTTGP